MNLRFLEKHKTNIVSAGDAYGVSKTQLGLILIRENRHYIYAGRSTEANFMGIAFWGKENVLARGKNMFQSYKGNADRWSPGVAQMQIKHAIRMEYNMSVEEYDQMKATYLADGPDSELGQVYVGMYQDALSALNDDKKAIELLAKYVSELNISYPNSTNEQIAKDYMRGPHLNRDPKAKSSKQADNDWEHSQRYEESIKDFFEENDSKEEK